MTLEDENNLFYFLSDLNLISNTMYPDVFLLPNKLKIKQIN